MSRVWDDGIAVHWPHPLRWLKYFVKAMLYGPAYSPYDEMAEAYNKEYGIEPKASVKAPGKVQGSKLDVSRGLTGYGPGGYSDTDDESYYGL